SVLDQLEGLGRLELLARGEDLAQVAALDELHDQVVLPRAGVLVDRQDLDDVGVLQGHADLAFTDEQLDLLRVLAPAPPQRLDGHEAAWSGIGSREDPAEGPRGDLVQDAVATQEVAVGIALEELLALPRRQLSLALEGHQELDRLGGLADLFPDLDELF